MNINNTTEEGMKECNPNLLDYEMPLTVFPNNHRTNENSIINNMCSVVLSNVNPYIVMPALLFSKYVTASERQKTSVLLQSD